MKPYLKICGNRSLEDVLIVAASNATHIGFVFAKSKRQVNPEEAAQWLKQVDTGGKRIVGVFVNSSIDEIAHVLSVMSLHVIQLHGTESPIEMAEIKRLFQVPVYKTIHHSSIGVEAMTMFEGIADGFVIDSKVEGAWGGTGVSFPWDWIPHYTAEANRQSVSCFIAGGINPDNVSECLSFRPMGIDLSSGIELNGRKSPERLMELEERMGEKK